MAVESLLQRLGLNQKETTLYLALLEHGASTVADIAKNTSIHRPVVYKHLPPLLEKGLVSTSQKGKRLLYVAESPEKLQGLFEQTKTELESVIPELLQNFHAGVEKPIMRYFTGKKGIAQVFTDLVTTLKTGDMFYRYSSAKNSRKNNNYLPSNYRTLRDKKKLERFVITHARTAKTKKPRMERAIKIVPEKYGLFDHDVTQIIYGNKIAFIDYNSETATIIENPQIANFQRQLFKLLYDKL